MRYELTYYAKPWTVNSERANSHWSQRNQETAQWRRDFKILTKASKVPPMKAIKVEVRHLCKGRLPDPGAIYPAVKAAIDGVVDAGVIPDDTGAYVKYIGMYAPEKYAKDGVVLIIEEFPS